METVKVCAPDGAVREVDGITGRRYKSRDGAYEMHPADARKLVAIGGFMPNVGGAPKGGYRCRACRFGSFFVRCGRCGGRCEKEA